MVIEELIKKLEGQLTVLRDGGEFPVHALQVFEFPCSVLLGEAFVRLERWTWGFGYCRSETCMHTSHDPYMSGDTIFLRAKKIGTDTDERETLYLLPNGKIARYKFAKESGYHFAPTARLTLE